MPKGCRKAGTARSFLSILGVRGYLVPNQSQNADGTSLSLSPQWVGPGWPKRGLPPPDHPRPSTLPLPCFLHFTAVFNRDYHLRSALHCLLVFSTKSLQSRRGLGSAAISCSRVPQCLSSSHSVGCSSRQQLLPLCFCLDSSRASECYCNYTTHDKPHHKRQQSNRACLSLVTHTCKTDSAANPNTTDSPEPDTS